MNCLFAFFEAKFIVLLENVLLIWRRPHCRWRAAKFDSWPLSSEGSLTCHTHCDAALPFIMVISEDPWHSHLMPSVWQWSCHYLFLQLRSVMSPDLPHVRRTLYLSYCECSLSGFAFIIYQNLGLLCSSEYINQLFTSRIALSLKIKPILFIFFVVNSDSV